MKDATSQVARAALLVALFSANAAAQLAVLQPTFSFEAAAVNGVPLKENATGEITAYRGDVILCEIYLRDWSPNQELLRGYVASLDDPSWISGSTGSIKPVDHEQTAANDVANEGHVFIDDLHPLSIAKLTAIVDPIRYRFRGFFTDIDDALLSPQDGTKRYCGSVRMKVSNDASGTFTLRLDPASSVLEDSKRQRLGPIDYEPLKIHVLTNVLRVIESAPPSGSINARRPHRPGAGWDRSVLTFDADTEAITATDFAVEDGTYAPPRVQRVVPEGRRITVILDRPISAGRWTAITHKASGTGTRIGSLPGDTTGNGLLDREDVFAVFKEPGDTELPLYQIDVDGDGRRGLRDALRAIELLQGPDVYRTKLSK